MALAPTRFAKIPDAVAALRERVAGAEEFAAAVHSQLEQVSADTQGASVAWRAAKDECQNSLEAARRELQAAQHEEQSVRAELAKNVEQLEQRNTLYTNLESRLATCEQQHAEFRRKYDGCTAKSKGQESTFEEMRRDCVHLSTKMDAQAAELARCNEAHAAAQQEWAREREVMRAQLENASANLQRLAALHGASKDEVASALRVCNDERQRLRAQAAEHAECARRIATLEQDLATARATAPESGNEAALAHELARLQAELDAEKTARASHDAGELEGLRAELDTLRAQQLCEGERAAIGAHKKQIEELAHERDVARAEAEALRAELAQAQATACDEALRKQHGEIWTQCREQLRTATRARNSIQAKYETDRRQLLAAHEAQLGEFADLGTKARKELREQHIAALKALKARYALRLAHSDECMRQLHARVATIDELRAELAACKARLTSTVPAIPTTGAGGERIRALEAENAALVETNAALRRELDARGLAVPESEPASACCGRDAATVAAVENVVDAIEST